MVLLFYTTYISVDLVQHGLFRAKVGKGGIIWSYSLTELTYQQYVAISDEDLQSMKIMETLSQ